MASVQYPFQCTECGRFFKKAQGRHDHMRTVHHTQSRATPSSTMSPPGAADAHDHRKLFRNALEETKEFVPGAAHHITNPQSTPKNNKPDQNTTETSGGKEKTNKATGKLAYASMDDAANGETGRASSYAARILGLDDLMYSVNNDPRYALCRWEDCGYCGRCMMDIQPELYQDEYGNNF